MYRRWCVRKEINWFMHAVTSSDAIMQMRANIMWQIDTFFSQHEKIRQNVSACWNSWGNTTLRAHFQSFQNTITAQINSPDYATIYVTTQLITTEWLPALFSLSFSRVLIWALSCSCKLRCKKDSFMRSISSSTQDICNKGKMVKKDECYSQDGIKICDAWGVTYLHWRPFWW